MAPLPEQACSDASCGRTYYGKPGDHCAKCLASLRDGEYRRQAAEARASCDDCDKCGDYMVCGTCAKLLWPAGINDVFNPRWLGRLRERDFRNDAAKALKACQCGALPCEECAKWLTGIGKKRLYYKKASLTKSRPANSETALVESRQDSWIRNFRFEIPRHLDWRVLFAEAQIINGVIRWKDAPDESDEPYEPAAVHADQYTCPPLVTAPGLDVRGLASMKAFFDRCLNPVQPSREIRHTRQMLVERARDKYLKNLAFDELKADTYALIHGVELPGDEGRASDAEVEALVEETFANPPPCENCGVEINPKRAARAIRISRGRHPSRYCDELECEKFANRESKRASRRNETIEVRLSVVRYTFDCGYPVNTRSRETARIQHVPRGASQCPMGEPGCDLTLAAHYGGKVLAECYWDDEDRFDPCHLPAKMQAAYVRVLRAELNKLELEPRDDIG